MTTPSITGVSMRTPIPIAGDTARIVRYGLEEGTTITEYGQNGTNERIAVRIWERLEGRANFDVGVTLAVGTQYTWASFMTPPVGNGRHRRIIDVQLTVVRVEFNISIQLPAIGIGTSGLHLGQGFAMPLIEPCTGVGTFIQYEINRLVTAGWANDPTGYGDRQVAGAGSFVIKAYVAGFES